jgi:hypothetical protein
MGRVGKGEDGTIYGSYFLGDGGQSGPLVESKSRRWWKEGKDATEIQR